MIFDLIFKEYSFAFLPALLLIGFAALLVIRIIVLVVDVVGKILDAIPFL